MGFLVVWGFGMPGMGDPPSPLWGRVAVGFEESTLQWGGLLGSLWPPHRWDRSRHRHIHLRHALPWNSFTKPIGGCNIQLHSLLHTRTLNQKVQSQGIPGRSHIQPHGGQRSNRSRGLGLEPVFHSPRRIEAIPSLCLVVQSNFFNNCMGFRGVLEA